MAIPVLVWKHGKTRADVHALIQAELHAHGYASKVTWQNDSFSTSIGYGAILSLEGEITDSQIILHKCKGAMSGVVLAKGREMLEQIIPGGEQGQAADSDRH